MTDLTLAEREQLEALQRHLFESHLTEAEKAERQAKLDRQMADYRILLACETGAARIYLDGVNLDALVGPETTALDIFRAFGRDMKARVMQRMARQPLDASRSIELLDPITGECAPPTIG